MCVIIDRPANHATPSEWFSNAVKHNPDGWGIMSADSGRISIRRGFGYAAFLEAYHRVPRSHPCTVHFRYATHGGKTLANCHPFDVLGGRYAIMHNGVMPDVAIVDKARSDTWHFCHHILAPILDSRPGWFGTPLLHATLGTLIGDGNKLVILRADGSKMIVNADQGETVQGCWVSNTYSLKPTRFDWSGWSTEDFGFGAASGSTLDDCGDPKNVARRLAAAGDRRLLDDDSDPVDVEIATADADCPADPYGGYRVRCLDEFKGWDYDAIQDYVCEYPDDIVDMIWQEHA